MVGAPDLTHLPPETDLERNWAERLAQCVGWWIGLVIAMTAGRMAWRVSTWIMELVGWP